MSQKIRIGNDIDIRWSLVDADENPYILEGRDVRIELNVGTKKVRIKDIELDGNTVHFVYYGKDQRYTGSYILKFIENDGVVDMVTFDTKDAFTLVEHSWLAIDEGEEPERVYLEFVTVSSNLMERVGPPGPAAGFGDVTASIDEGIGTPYVDVSTSGPNTAKNITFNFHNLKGEQGQQGQQGQPGDAAGFGTIEATVDDETGEPSVDVTVSGPNTAKNIRLDFHNLKGERGADGGSVWGNITGTLSDQSDLNTELGKKYEKPVSGIPASDLADGVVPDNCVTFEELSGGEDIPVEPISGGGGELSDEVKQAILDAFEQVAWVTNQGQTYYNALAELFFPPKTLTSITAVYTQSGTVYDDASLDSLKANLVVTAHYDDNTSAVISSGYTLSGTLSAGTSTVTVTYQSKTTTFSVTVTARPTVANITATYTQSGTVYTTDSLDSLKSDLVVKAVYTDTTEDTLNDSDYTLSGTLTAGTSTITVTFQTFTTTFTVTVTEMQVYSITNSLTGCSSSNNATSANEGSSYSATITASTGYTLTGATVSVTMGGTDITSTAYNNGTISIASVTGNVVITIVAEVVSGTWVDLNTSMFTATRSDVTINAAGFIHQENVVTTSPETKYPEIILDSRITGLDFDIDNTGAYTWLILAGTKDDYGAIALTQSSGGFPAEMIDGQTGKTTGLGGTKLNGCPSGNGHYTVTRDSSGITISKTGGASVTYTTANQPLYDYGTSASWIFGFCIQPSSPTGNGYKNVKVKFGGNE